MTSPHDPIHPASAHQIAVDVYCFFLSKVFDDDEVVVFVVEELEGRERTAAPARDEGDVRESESTMARDERRNVSTRRRGKEVDPDGNSAAPSSRDPSRKKIRTERTFGPPDTPHHPPDHPTITNHMALGESLRVRAVSMRGGEDGRGE